MTIPRQTADTKISHPAPSDSASQVAIDDAHSNYGTTHSFAGDSSIALATLWDENHLSIENELQRHLHSDSNSPLLQQLLQRLVWHARFFCDEVDDPNAWVARSANLEARRMVLQLTKTR